MDRRSFSVAIALTLTLGVAWAWMVQGSEANLTAWHATQDGSDLENASTAPTLRAGPEQGAAVNRVAAESLASREPQTGSLADSTLDVRIWRGPLRIPVRGAEVEVHWADGSSAHGVTVASGTARFAGSVAGECSVLCEGARVTTMVVPAPGQVVDVLLPNVRHVAGRVVTPNGHPHGGAELYIAERDQLLQLVGRTDESGTYSIDVPVGRWICARARGFAPSLAFRAEECLELRLREARSSVSIQVNRDGKPTARARVHVQFEESIVPTAQGPGRIRFSFELSADAHGRARLEDLPTGRLQVRAASDRAEGGSTAWLDPGHQTVLVALEELRRYCGVVTDRAGHSVSGAVIFVGDGRETMRTTTDSEGQFELWSRTIETRWLSDHAEPTQGAVVRAFHPREGLSVAFVQPGEQHSIQLDRESCFQGDLAGHADRALFVACFVDGERVPSYRGRSGRFWAVAPHDASVDVEVRASGCAFPVARTTLVAGTPQTISVRAPVATCATGRVDATGGTLVFLHATNGESAFAQVGPRGAFSCAGLVPGRYRVGYQHPGRTELQWIATRDVGPGGEQLGALRLGPPTWGEVHMALSLAMSLADRWQAEIHTADGKVWLAPTQFVTRDLVAQLPEGDYIACLRNVHGSTTQTPFTVHRGQEVQLQLSDRGIE